jgi:hypothetical protein
MEVTLAPQVAPGTPQGVMAVGDNTGVVSPSVVDSPASPPSPLRVENLEDQVEVVDTVPGKVRKGKGYSNVVSSYAFHRHLENILINLS